MATYSANYNFTLPSSSDTVSPSPFNSNFTAIDTKLKELQDGISGVEDSPWTIVHQGTFTLPNALSSSTVTSYYNTYTVSGDNLWEYAGQSAFFQVPISSDAQSAAFDEMVFIVDNFTCDYQYYSLDQLTNASSTIATMSNSTAKQNALARLVPDFAVSFERSFGITGKSPTPKRATIVARGGVSHLNHTTYLSNASATTTYASLSALECSWNTDEHTISSPNSTIIRYSKRDDYEIMLPYSDDQGVEVAYQLASNSPYGSTSTNRHTAQRAYYDPQLGPRIFEDSSMTTRNYMDGPVPTRPIYNAFNSSDRKYLNSMGSQSYYNAGNTNNMYTGSILTNSRYIDRMGAIYSYDHPMMAFPLPYIPLFVFYRSMAINAMSMRITLLGKNRSYSNRINL